MDSFSFRAVVLNDSPMRAPGDFELPLARQKKWIDAPPCGAEFQIGIRGSVRLSRREALDVVRVG